MVNKNTFHTFHYGVHPNVLTARVYILKVEITADTWDVDALKNNLFTKSPMGMFGMSHTMGGWSRLQMYIFFL